MSVVRGLAISIAGLLCLAAPVAAAPELRDVVTMDGPMYVAGAPGDRSRLFIVEHSGQISVMEDGELLERPFLDISDRVQRGGFRGLLSMAFAPDYERSRRFYVFFTDRLDRTRIEEYRRSRSDPSVARPGTRRNVIAFDLPEFPESDSPHLGGQIDFGPDDFLYVSTGDGSRGFRDSRLTRTARDRKSLLGKLLRIDPVRRGRRYGIPRSNPYAGRTPGRGEIFARGLRNPWRFSFDGKRIALSDDGESAREEVNLLSPRRLRGADLGWPAFEGSRRIDSGVPRRLVTMPAFEYAHRSDTPWGADCTGGVIGGYVVRDRRVPSLYGRYVYGEYCFQEVRSFDPADPAGTDRFEFTTPPPTSFGRDSRGRIYVTFEGGRIARLAETG